MSPLVHPPLPSIAAAVADAQWLAHRYDPGTDSIHLLRTTRAEHRRATFLTDAELPEARQPLIVRRADAMLARPKIAPLHFIFHSAYCCSTLLARAFDVPGVAMGLKEPVLLNDIVGWRRRGDDGPDMATALDDLLALLGRPFQPSEAVIVKPSTIVNCLAAPMLALRPHASALLLYAPLRTYLGSIARKGLEGRLWVRQLLLGLLDDKMIPFGFSPRDHIEQTDLQVAAVGWLTQKAIFTRLVAQFGAGRVRTLDSETLLARPHAALAKLAELYSLELDARATSSIADGPAFTRHSKSGDPFTAADRSAADHASADIYGEEIEKVVVWAEAVARSAGLSLILPAPLLG